MDSTCRTKTLQAINKSISNGGIKLSHKLQRPEGQWNKQQKTDLIDSLLRKYPINPTYAIKEDGVLSVIDGVQRLSCVRDFLANSFSLSKTMEPVMVNGEEKNLAGLKFSKLDEDTKNEILSSELQIYELTDCTEKDVREMFRRQNAGKPLNVKQLRIVKESDEFSNMIYELTSHPFMKKLMTKAQQKNGTDKDVIVQTLMLIQTDADHDYTSFRSKDMDAFVSDYGNTDNKDTLKDVFGKFDSSFEEIRIPVTSIPMVLYSGYRVVKNKKSFSKLVDVINDFNARYDQNEQYKQFVKSGTSSTENVKGRFEYWKELIKGI